MSEYTEHVYQEYHGKTYEPIRQREEIVRCRDCEYYGISSEYAGWGCTRFKFGSWNKESLSNGFCAWGERRVGE